MDIAKDNISIEDERAIVFTDVDYRISNSTLLCRRNTTTQVILDGASGAIRPGRLTFILGPSGAGKTTLLKILGGRKKYGVTGHLYGAGRNAVLVAQHVSLIDTLTAEETLRFAASLKLPDLTPRERMNVIIRVARQLGIYDVIKTKAGCLSGGERKRLTIACELLTDPQIMLLDEPTSGLDTVSSMSVTKALLAVAQSGRTVACVIHQPSSQIFTSADDVILLANGKTLYAGSISDIPDALAKSGLACPQYYNMADYLLEIASSLNSSAKGMLECEAYSYAQEMRKIVKNDFHNDNGNGHSPESEALLISVSPSSNTYAASCFQQFRALFWRCFLGTIRDVHLTQIRMVTHLIVALLLGALYQGVGSDAGRIITNTSCLFFFLLFLFFSNAMPTIHTFPSEATVVLQEHLNKWYSLSIYCICKIIIDLPVQLLCATLFLFPAWYLTSQPIETHRMVIGWSVCALVTILAQTFGLVIGAAFGMKLGLFVIPAANIPMLMFSEFFIPYKEVPVYLRPFAIISYFRYAFDALLEAVYGLDRDKLPCHKVFCMFKNTEDYLQYIGLSRNLRNDILALVTWIIILQISLICVLAFKVYKSCR